jgi:hypothetical protein
MVQITAQLGKSLRAQRRGENLAKVARPPGLRVEPGAHPSMTADQIRKIIRHPRGMAFRPTGSVEWPNDRFTQKQLRAGVIKLATPEPPPEQQEATRRETRNERREERREG